MKKIIIKIATVQLMLLLLVIISGCSKIVVDNTDVKDEKLSVKEELSNEDTIKKYYDFLENKKLQEAYDMYEIKRTDFDTFKSLHENKITTRPYQMNVLDNGYYHYFVNFTDNDKLEEKYRIILQVAEGRINTVESNKLTSEIEIFENMSTYVTMKDVDNFVVLLKDGKETVIDSGGIAFGSMEKVDKDYEDWFKDPQFSPKGNYVYYTSQFYNRGGVKIYSIKTGKIFEKINGFGKISFSEDEKFLYRCTLDANLPSAKLEVYSTEKNLENIYSSQNFADKTGIFVVSSCELSEDGTSVIARFANNAKSYDIATEKVTAVYDFGSGEIKISE